MLNLDHFKTIKKHVLLLKQSNLLIFWFSESFHQSSLCRSAHQNKKNFFFHKLTQSEREREKGERVIEKGGESVREWEINFDPIGDCQKQIVVCSQTNKLKILFHKFLSTFQNNIAFECICVFIQCDCLSVCVSCNKKVFLPFFPLLFLIYV